MRRLHKLKVRGLFFTIEVIRFPNNRNMTIVPLHTARSDVVCLLSQLSHCSAKYVRFVGGGQLLEIFSILNGILEERNSEKAAPGANTSPGRQSFIRERRCLSKDLKDQTAHKCHA